MLDHIAGVVRTRWSGRDEDAPVGALPRELAEGRVVRVIGGGPFGWMMDARIDVVGGRIALEVLEDSRMAGPDHYRVWEDGTVEPLPGEHTGYAWPNDATPAEVARIRDRYHEHNRAVQAQLRRRGFRS